MVERYKVIVVTGQAAGKLESVPTGRLRVERRRGNDYQL